MDKWEIIDKIKESLDEYNSGIDDLDESTKSILFKHLVDDLAELIKEVEDEE